MTNGNNEEGEDPDEQVEDDDQSAVMLTGTSTVDENGIIQSSAQFLHVIAQQKAYLMQNSLPNRGIELLNELEQLVVDSKLYTCNKQMKLSPSFNKGVHTHIAVAVNAVSMLYQKNEYAINL